MIAKDVMQQSRIFLNDVAASSFTDDVLLPFLQTAWAEMAELFEENELPATNNTSAVIPVTTTQFDIGGPTGPALPQDLIEIQGVYERPTGTLNDFTEVVKRDFLPKTSVLTNVLGVYVWQGQVIKFLGANTNIDVKLDYLANVFNPLIDPSSIVNIINAKTSLAYRTAGLAASMIGENPDRAAELNGFASTAAERLINISMKGQQAIASRRRPFRAGYKTRGSI